MKGFAIHTIHRRPAPDKEIEVLPAGAVFDTSHDELRGYAEEGAARVATAVDAAAWAERQETERLQRPLIDPLAIPAEIPGEEEGGAGDKSAEPPSLSGKNKAELLDIAKAEGVTVEDGATNAQIVEAIEAKRDGSDAPTE